MAQAFSPPLAHWRKAACRATASGVVRPVDAKAEAPAGAAESPAADVKGSPTPSVPTTPQRRPSKVSACATHQVHEVLPLVPVTATTSSAWLG